MNGKFGRWLKTGAAAAVLGIAALTASGASAATKEAGDVHIIFITHGQANDVYWSVVKNGVQAGQKAMGARVDYHAPETFDMVQMAHLIDAAVAEKPDAIVVSIPDADALKQPIMDAKAAGIPVGVIDSGQDQVHDWGLDLWVGGGSEYDNGVKAGEIMGKAGVKHTVCVNHEVGNVSLDDRCRGFKDGLAKNGEAATVESVKAASDVYCPLDGEIVEINEAITSDPSLVNSDPQGAGWFFKLKLSNVADANDLLDEAAYKELVG